MTHRHSVRLALCLALGIGLGAVPLSAQVPIGDPAPLGPEVLVNQAVSYEQEWAKVAIDPDQTRFAVAWNSGLSHIIWVRFFAMDGTPLSNDVQVNTTLTTYIQDEPMVAMDGDGNTIVCWSDRNGYDGWQMGCFGRVFDETGAPLGPEFQINLSGAAASQWEPMPAALPGGGWVVAFNGDLDGNAYLRYLQVDGTPFSGDVAINTFLNNGQTEAECAVTPDGTVLAVYADFGGNVQGGTGTNLLVRRFDDTGLVLDPLEAVVNSSTLNFDQLEPRIAAHDDGFVMVWEDWGNDGDSVGIYARLYAMNGTALGPEFKVNEVTAGAQRLPEVACDSDGNFVVCWEDLSTGSGQVHARAYLADGTPLSVGFLVSGNLPDVYGPQDGYHRPQVDLSADGTQVVFSFSGPGQSGGFNNEDVYFRRYSWERTPDAGVNVGRLRRRPGSGMGSPLGQTPFKIL